MKQRTATALACSLLLLVVAIVLAVVYRGDKPRLLPRTRLDSTRAPDAPRRARADDPSPLAEPSPSTTPGDSSIEESRFDDGAPEGVPYEYLPFRARVHSDGQPVQGVVLYARLLEYDADGTRIPFSLTLDPMSGLKSDASGIVEGGVAYPRDSDMASVVAVFAHHPQVGLGYAEYSLEELSTLRPEDMPLELESESSVEGSVVNSDGNVVPNAVVTLYTRCTSGINLSGLRSVSGEDGAFQLRGISLENEPVLVHVRHGTKTRRGANATTASGAETQIDDQLLEGQKAVRPEFLDRTSMVWNMGEIQLLSRPGREAVRDK